MPSRHFLSSTMPHFWSKLKTNVGSRLPSFPTIGYKTLPDGSHYATFDYNDEEPREPSDHWHRDQVRYQSGIDVTAGDTTGKLYSIYQYAFSYQQGDQRYIYLAQDLCTAASIRRITSVIQHWKVALSDSPPDHFWDAEDREWRYTVLQILRRAQQRSITESLPPVTVGYCSHTPRASLVRSEEGVWREWEEVRKRIDVPLSAEEKSVYQTCQRSVWDFVGIRDSERIAQFELEGRTEGRHVNL